MDERSIIKLFLYRAEGAIDALAKKFGSKLKHLCMNILSNTQDAEECVSDTYLALWNAIPPANPDPLSAYVYKTGRNVALKRLRSRTAQKRSGYEVSLEELSQCIPGIDTESTWEAKALGEAIDSFLSTLPQESRVLFLRRYWFGDSLKDIRHLTGIRENTLAVRLSRIRSDLKDYLRTEGFL